MSKLLNLFVLIISAGVSVHVAWGRSELPPLVVSIRVESVGGRTLLLVNGKFVERRKPEFAKTFSLSLPPNTKADPLELRDDAGEKIPFRELSKGDYLAEREIFAWTYFVDLTSTSMSRPAHHSWVSGESGLLMMRDFWPVTRENGDRAILSLGVPHGWEVATPPRTMTAVPKPPNTEDGGAWYYATEKSVFAIGNGWRNMQMTVAGASLDFAISGSWHFTDDELVTMTSEVFAEYGKLFGSAPSSGRIILARFPTQARPGEWQAETRGNTVTVISSDMPFRTQSLQRLHEQLRHEMFHLWIPNNVNLTGNYDWFYEGFALYKSLKLAVALNRIRFEDLLDTLSRAHTIDSGIPQNASLIQGSKSRLSGANTQVYARGMLIAFLTDVALLQKSKGKRSIDDVLTELYRRHQRSTRPVDGNDAVLSLLRSYAELVPIVDRYVNGTEKINWAADLAGAGIEDSDAGPMTTLRVSEKLNGRQKALLDKLGYNNWRKLPRSSK